MFHDDIQTQHTHSSHRSTAEHPIDRLLTSYFNNEQKIRYTRSNNQKSETNHIMQRQRVIRSFLSKSDDVEPPTQKTMSFNLKAKPLSTTSIAFPQPLFTELTETTTCNQNNQSQPLKRALERQSPIIIRRNRPTIENIPPVQQGSDMARISGSHVTLNIPPNFTFRNKLPLGFLSDRSSLKIRDSQPPPQTKPLVYSKTMSENSLRSSPFMPKYNPQTSFLPMNKWSPTLTDPGVIHLRSPTGIPRSRSQLSKYSLRRRHLHVEHTREFDKINTKAEIFIPPRTFNVSQFGSEPNKKREHKKFNSDEWEDSKWSNSGYSDEDESFSADGNSSSSTCTSQVSIPQYSQVLYPMSPSDPFEISLSPPLSSENLKPKSPHMPIKRNISRRRMYNIALPPVAEHINDEETDSIDNTSTCADDMNNILEKLVALQNRDNNENEVELITDDEQSLTFHLLNQDDTDFEKKLSKLRHI